MKPRVRETLFIAAGGALLLWLVWGFSGLSAFGFYPGPYGTVLNAVAPSQRHIPNIITAVNFDYRGVDTMVEELILFAAVAGMTLVLRTDRGRTKDEPLPCAAGRTRAARTDAVRAFSILGIAVTIAFGIYMAIHPHLTPGGGFQGGTIAAGFVALAFLGLGYQPFVVIVRQEPAELFEAIGAGGYAAIGIATLGVSGAFLANVLPLGAEGEFFSTGTIPLINIFVALAVVMGFMVVFLEFVRETRAEEQEE